MEVISLCLKEIFNSFQEHFSSPIPPGLVITEIFILFIFSVMQLPSHQQTYINGREQNEFRGWKNKTPSSPLVQHVRRLFPFSLEEDIKLLLMLRLSMLDHKTFVCFRCHGS